MEKLPEKQSSTFNLVSGVAIVVAILTGIGISSKPPGKPESITTEYELPKQSPKKPDWSYLPPITEECTNVSSQFESFSKLTELQKEELWKKYRHRRFSWTLKLREVVSLRSGGYKTLWACPESSILPDLEILYPEASREALLQLEKSQTYENITGRLTDQFESGHIWRNIQAESSE